MGEDNVWQIRFETVLNRGFVNIDVWYIVSNIIVPVCLSLLDMLVIPFFAARVVGSVFLTSYTHRSLLVRHSFGTYLLLRALMKLGGSCVGLMRKKYDEIRDSRYLLGSELTNREPA